MQKEIDCFLIGNNREDFEEYEKKLRKMDRHSCAYRDLDLSFITFDNHPYSASRLFNSVCFCDLPGTGNFRPINLDEAFSAAAAYLGTFLNKNRLTFDYVNSFQQEKEELAEKLKLENIRTIAIITTLYVTPLPILEIIDFVRKYNQTARIIVGGPFISNKVRTLGPAERDYLFKSMGADFYVNSPQGEAALVRIIRALKEGGAVDQVPNIHYRTPGGYAAAPTLPEDNKLSENTVNWELFSHRVGEYVNIRTAISCPFSCAFCGFPEHAGKYQTADLEMVERELKLLDKLGPVKSVYFIDDTFNVPLKRFKKILRMLIKNKFTFKWHCHFRAQFTDSECVRLMKESGCEGVFLGIESGSDQILQNMNKAATVERYRQGIALLNRYEIPTFGSFIIGFPGETLQTVEETTTFIKESGLDFFRTQLWYCDPVTPIWREREKYGIKGESFEWSHRTMDSRTAADLIERIFLSVETPVWVPQYNFDFDSLLNLLHQGMSVAQVKAFLTHFNNGVKEKLMDPDREEVSASIIMKIRESCPGGWNHEDIHDAQVDTIDAGEAEFDF